MLPNRSMHRCPHCQDPTISTLRKMRAGSATPALCPKCSRASYVCQPLIDSLYWLVFVSILGVAITLALAAWWIFPFVLWILMLARCPLRLLGRLRTTVVFPRESLWHVGWLAAVIVLPVVSVIGILWSWLG